MALNEATLQQMTDIADYMSATGVPVNRDQLEGLIADRMRLKSEEQREKSIAKFKIYLDRLRQIRTAGSSEVQWSFHPHWRVRDPYWVCSDPPLFSFPSGLFKAVPESVHVFLYQVNQFLAAVYSQNEEALTVYRDGGDLTSHYAQCLGLPRTSSKVIFYQFLFGRNEELARFQATMPWLVEIRNLYAEKRASGERITTWFGTDVSATIPPLGVLGSIFQKTVLDLTREAILQASTDGYIPHVILPDSVVGPPGIEESFQKTLSGYYGLRSAVEFT